MPAEGIECVDHGDILTYEEIAAVAEAAAGLGIQKIKITGGEPLVRKGIVSLVRRIKNIPGIQEVTMTTNGVLLKCMAAELKKAGLDAINISLDTLDRNKFMKLTRFDKYEEVFNGIRAAKESGIKTKLNCVPLKDFNEDELITIASLANQGIQIRFIEIMPMGLGKEYELIPYKIIKRKLEEAYGISRPDNEKYGNGPAVYYRFPGLKESIGFITAMSHEFCHSCNRIRLTAEGELKLCLHHKDGVALKPYLRNHIAADQLMNRLQEAIFNKPSRHCFRESKGKDAEERNMVQIGG
jgi:cyclic pyranopterin phosphate synthase